MPVVATACLAALAARAQTAVPARPHVLLAGAHWGFDASADEGGGARVVRISDTTGDRRVRAALEDFVARWSALRGDPRLDLGALPRVEVARLHGSRGCDTPRYEEIGDGPGEVVVCRDDRLATSGVGGPYWVDPTGHTRFGLVKLRSSTLKWSTCNLRTAVAHEMGHVMGLAHNETPSRPGDPSVMSPGKGPYNRGCPTWFNAADRNALRALYGHDDPRAAE